MCNPHSGFWGLYYTKFIPFPYPAEPEQKRTREMKLRPNPQRIKGQIFQSIRSYVFVAWFPDLSVAIRICILACLYILKANRNQFSKYFEIYMILKDDCTERPLLAIEVWNSSPLLGYQNVLWVTWPASARVLSSTRGKSLGTRLVWYKLYDCLGQNPAGSFCWAIFLSHGRG
jgi:hypothetical protein